MHLYLPSPAGDERLELVDVDLSHAALVHVLGEARLDPRVVEAVLDICSFPFKNNRALVFKVPKRALSNRVRLDLPDVFDKQLADEVLSQVRRVSEVLGVEAVVDVGDVGECFLLGVAQKRRGTTESRTVA